MIGKKELERFNTKIEKVLMSLDFLWLLGNGCEDREKSCNLLISGLEVPTCSEARVVFCRRPRVGSRWLHVPDIAVELLDSSLS